MTDTTTGTRIIKMYCEVAKVEESLGLVFGWSMVCKIDGTPYVDLQDQHITERGMLKMILGFVKNHGSVAHDMHTDVIDGSFPFAFPLTTDIAESLGITTSKTGAIIGYQPETDGMLQKFSSGLYKGFSIAGGVKAMRRVRRDSLVLAAA